MTTAEAATSIEPTPITQRTRRLWIALAILQLAPFLFLAINLAFAPVRHAYIVISDVQWFLFRLTEAPALGAAVAQLAFLMGYIVWGKGHWLLRTLGSLAAVCLIFKACYWMLSFNVWSLHSGYFDSYFDQGYATYFFGESMPVHYCIALLLVAIGARIYPVQLLSTKTTANSARNFQFRIIDLLAAMLLVSGLIAFWKWQDKSGEEFFLLLFSRNNYYDALAVDQNDIPLLNRQAVIIDSRYLLFKASLAILPLFFLSSQTPKRGWLLVFVFLSIIQFALDRYNFSQQYTFDRPPPFSAPFEVFHLLLSWYLLTHLGYHFTRSPISPPLSSP